MSDAAVLFRDVAGDAAQNAANKINPSEDRLNRIDDPAEDNTWHDVPSVSDLKGQAKDVYNKNKPLDRDDLKDAAGNATEQAHPSGSRDPRDAAQSAAEDQAQGTNSGVDAKGGAKQGAQDLKNKMSANIDDETKDNVKDAGRTAKLKGKDYLNQKMPQERRDQTIWRLKKMIVEIQGHDDCRFLFEHHLVVCC